MKINKLLIGANALLILGLATSCSNNEPSSVNGGNGEGITKYMTVRIQGTTSMGSRAATDGGEEAGSAAENKLTSVRFYFFDDKGDAYPVSSDILADGITTAESNMITPTGITTETGAPNSEGLLILHIPAEKVVTPPSRVVCLANLTNDQYATYKGLSLPNLQQVQLEGGVTTTDGNFVMSTTTYKKGNDVINYTDITGNLFSSAEAAKSNPANIYIERLAAKVRSNVTNFTNTYIVKKKDDTGNISDADFEFDQDGTKIKLGVELTGWKIYNSAENSYLIKSLDGITSDPFANWNDAVNFRSYWAVVPELTLGNTSHNLSEGTNFTTTDWYAYENTSADNSKMVVRGIVKTLNADGTLGAAVDFVRWGGLYYTKTAFLNLVKTNTGFDNVELTPDNDGLDNAWKVVRVTQADGALNPTYTDIPQYKDIYYWENGVTSYVINIEHLGNKNAMVRNHIYDYAFQNTIGLGIPGDIPNPREEKETYLAALLHITNWKVVTHSINLGE